MTPPAKKDDRLAKLDRLNKKKMTEEEALEKVHGAQSDETRRTWNKAAFFEGATSKYARLDERQGTSAHFVTAEEMALEILQRAGVAWVQPWLIIPLAEVLKEYEEPVIEKPLAPPSNHPEMASTTATTQETAEAPKETEKK